MTNKEFITIREINKALVSLRKALGKTLEPKLNLKNISDKDTYILNAISILENL